MEKINEPFGISDERGLEIISDIVSVCTFSDGFSDNRITRYILSEYEGMEASYALYISGKLVSEHRNMEGGGLLQIGYNIQEIREFDDRSMLRDKILAKLKSFAKNEPPL